MLQITTQAKGMRRARVQCFHFNPVNHDRAMAHEPKLETTDRGDGAQFNQLITINKVAGRDQGSILTCQNTSGRGFV